MGVFVRTFNGLYKWSYRWWNLRMARNMSWSMNDSNQLHLFKFYLEKLSKYDTCTPQRYIYFTVNKREGNCFWKWLFCFKNLNLNVSHGKWRKDICYGHLFYFYCIFAFFQNKTLIIWKNLPFPFPCGFW